MTRRIFTLDLNWRREQPPSRGVGLCAAHDFADISAQAFLDYHQDFDITELWMPTSNWAGYTYYPTRLNCVAPGALGELFVRVYDSCQARDMPCWGYFCVGTDLHIAATRPEWVIPGSAEHQGWPMLAPESPWIDLLEARLIEFLEAYPVHSMMLDWFVYGSVSDTDFPVQPTFWANEPFERATGRPMPQRADQISAAEGLAFKRHVLGQNAQRLASTIKRVSPKTEVVFNMPYHRADDPLWVDHPVLTVSDLLFAECSRADVVEWLLAVRRPEQQVMCMIHGRPDEDQCDVHSGAAWAERGCGLFSSALPVAPELRHHPADESALEAVRQLYRDLASLPA